MIKEIRICNFRHFEDVRFYPHEHTSLLCGLNGSGKSSIIDLVSRLQDFLLHGAPAGVLFSLADIPLWNKENYLSTCSIFFENIKNNTSLELFEDIIQNKSPLISIDLQIYSDKFQYACGSLLFCKNDHNIVYTCEYLTKNGDDVYFSIFGNATIEKIDTKESYKIAPEMSGLHLAANANADIKTFLDHFTTGIFTLSIDPRAMESSYEKPNEHIALSARNFPAWYAYQAGLSLRAVASCFQDYQAFIPGFVEMYQDPRRSPVALEARIKLSADKSYTLPFASLSHGQKVLCVLHTIIKLAPQGSSIFIDEFENFLSPSELVPLYSAMQDAFEERGLQFILVSHHQKTLNWFRDAAFIMTFSKDTPSVRLEAFDAEQHGEIYDYLNELAGA